VKTKITLLLTETTGFTSMQVIPTIAFLVKKSGGFVDKYISTKSVPDTIRELLTECCNIRYENIDPVIVDLIHEQGSDEVEAVYSCLISYGMLIPKDGYEVVTIDKMLIEEKYVRSIQSTPRL